MEGTGRRPSLRCFNGNAYMRRSAIIFLAILLLIGAVYRRVPINFFRAESGWYLFMSHADESTQRQTVRSFFTTSYGGHYTPLMFLAEFETAKIAGTSQSFWRWRQLVVLAVIGATLFATSAAICRACALPRTQTLAISAALVSVSIFQPQMVDLVGWPFMICQLTWMILFLLALFSSIRLTISPDDTRWAWMAATSGYGSMHALGLGLTTAFAVLVVLILFFAMGRRQLRAVIITLALLTVFHALAMICLLPRVTGPQHSADGVGPMSKLLLGFVSNFALAAWQTFVPATYSQPNEFSIAYCWPYGLLLIAGLIAWIFLLARNAPAARTPQTQLTFLLNAFSIVGFLTLITMIAARQAGRSLPDAAGNLTYFLFTPRYVVPLHFLLIPCAVYLLVLLARRAPRLTAIGCGAVAVAALMAQVEFQATTYRHIAPQAHISHSGAWQLILASARECRAAGLPLPNAPLVALTQEFSDWDPRMFEPLLRRELHLNTSERLELIPWPDYLATRAQYGRVPSLKLLEEKLQLSAR